MPEALAFAVTSLAVWRVTHFVVEEDGPFDVVIRLRRRAGTGAIGTLMDCFYCVSVWTAAPLALVLTRDPGAWALHWIALSGAACLLQRATSRPERDA